MYPEDSFQSLVLPNNWWDKDSSRDLCRGALVRSYISHVDQTPYAFRMLGRSQAEQHNEADMVVEPMRVGHPLDKTPLPVAAMPQYPGEVWAAYRAKSRPCIVVAVNSPVVDSKLTRGKPNNATAPTMLVAPFYGVAKGKRAGYSEVFVERVRHCEWPQFFWDHLPIERGEESILRLDQVQPIGMDRRSFETLGFRLSDTALELFDELLTWYLWGGVEEGSYLAMYREQIEATFTSGATS